MTVTPGLFLVPKLKFEHIHLTSYSKMRVDLAAQVSFTLTYHLGTSLISVIVSDSN